MKSHERKSPTSTSVVLSKSTGAVAHFEETKDEKAAAHRILALRTTNMSLSNILQLLENCQCEERRFVTSAARDALVSTFGDVECHCGAKEALLQTCEQATIPLDRQNNLGEDGNDMDVRRLQSREGEEIMPRKACELAREILRLVEEERNEVLHLLYRGLGSQQIPIVDQNGLTTAYLMPLIDKANLELQANPAWAQEIALRAENNDAWQTEGGFEDEDMNQSSDKIRKVVSLEAD